MQSRRKLRSAEWRHLIIGAGQHFPGGVVKIRKAFVNYSVQVGFEFKYVKNEDMHS